MSDNKEQHEGKRSKAGRPELAENKRKARSFKANDAEWEIILKNASKAEMTVSEFIRHRTMLK